MIFQPHSMKPREVIYVVGMLGVFYLVIRLASGCLTPRQAADVTDSSCQTVEALTTNATVESVCELAPGLAELAALALEARAAQRVDGGARGTASCRIIPTTTVCATNAEILSGIRALKAKR